MFTHPWFGVQASYGVWELALWCMCPDGTVMNTKVLCVCLIKILKLRSSAAEVLPVAVMVHPNTLNTGLCLLIRSPPVLCVSFSTTTQDRVFLKKLVVPQLLSIFAAFCGTWMSFIVFTTACQLSLFCARLIQSAPFHLIFLKVHFNIISSTPSSAEWLLLFRYTRQNPARILYSCVPRVWPISPVLTWSL